VGATLTVHSAPSSKDRAARPLRRPTRLVPLLLAIVLVAGSCSSSGEKPGTGAPSGDDNPELVAQVASYDVVAGRAGRFIVGLLAGDGSRLVAFGSVDLTFTYLGERGSSKPAGASTEPVAARFLPIPGQQIDPSSPGPRFVRGSEGIGVYGAPDVTFDRQGFWQVAATATIDGKARRAEAAFEVLDESNLPAVGDPAPRTIQPLAGAADVEPRAIDSRAGADNPIPDPELHATTIAAAIDAGKPVMVVVSTPTYCQSRFCGPITDSVSALAKLNGDRMAFVHLEVWKDFEKNELNKAAAEWIFPSGAEDAREPWVFVVGRDGRITHRFDNVATDDELAQAVAEVTR